MGLKPREVRRPVSVRARLRTDAGWSDVTIGNISSRGLILRSAAPIPPRSYIEVRRQNVVVVGKIVWSSGLHCGVATQDRVDIEALVSAPPAPADKAVNDRRSVARIAPEPPAPATPADLFERSQRWARAFDFAAVAALAAMAAGFLASAVFDTFASPLAEATIALDGG